MKLLLITLLTALACTCLDAAEITEITLWEGRAVCDNWTNQPSLLSDGGAELRMAGAEAGQEIRFYAQATEPNWRLDIYEGHWTGMYASFANAPADGKIVVDLSQPDSYLSFLLTSDMLSQANKKIGWGGTFVGNGDNVIVTRITLVLQPEADGLSPLVINEIMQSNIDATMDDRNDFPDSWVELYNPNASAVNLGRYSLGTTDNPREAWQLPSLTIGGHQHKIIYCDKEALGRHTNFRLESGKGCSVYLFRLGEVADRVTGLKKQPAPNVAYGRKTDGAETWGYQATPTPEAANCGALCTEVLGNPIFSEAGRVISGNSLVTLRVTMPEGAPEGTVIRYTTNGSEPVASSSVFPADGLKFSSTRVIRAKPFCEGYLSPRSTTHSYIFFPRQMTIPVVSIVTDQRYLTDNKLGIYVDGNYESGQKNYRHDWRRPINFEYFTSADEASQINQLCETRVAGAASRDAKLKSLAVYAHKRFGEKRLAYELFPEDRPGQTDYKSIMLRNAGNDFDYLYMRDAIIQRHMARYADLDHQAYSPAIVYMNGVYKGILNLRERSNDDNIYTNYDGLEDIDMIENWEELKAGTWQNFEDFTAFYSEHGHTWEEYAERMDLIEYINLMIMNLYFCNLDFPGNNIVMWRPTTEDGRWRFIAKDTDFGLGLYGRSSSYNTIEWIYKPDYDRDNNWANQEEDTRLFRRLMEDETFAREFQDRCAIYMGDFLNYESTWATWEPMYAAIRYEYPNHRKLINEWWPNYNDEINSAKNWLKARTDIFYNMVAKYYKLGTLRPLTINRNLTELEREDAPVRFNGVDLSANKFDGKFYQGRKVTLQGGATEEGRGVTGWSVRTVSSNGQLTTTHIDGATYEFTMPECARCEITAIVGNIQGIEAVQADRDDVPTAIYDINGTRHNRLVKGHNIVVTGKGVAINFFGF